MTVFREKKAAVIGITAVFILLSVYCRAKEISIQKGITTKAEIAEALDKPYITKTVAGKELWFYKNQSDKNFPFLSSEKMLLYIQFNNNDIVEDVGGVAENDMPLMIPRSSLQIWKAEGEEKQRLANRNHNQVTYGKPDQESRDGTGETWYYIISKEPTDKKDVSKAKLRAIRFDNSGNFVKEWMTNTVLYERVLTPEEKVNLNADKILEEARLQTRGSFQGLVIDDADKAYKQGSTFNDAKQYNEAILWFKKVIELKPRHGMAYFGLAYAYQETGQEDLAIANYEKGISLEPNFKAAYAPLAFFYMKKENVEKAYKYAKEAQRLDPTNPDIKKVVKELESSFGKTLTVSMGSTRDEIIRMLGVPATFHKLGAINKDGVPEQLEYLAYHRQNWDVVYYLKNDIIYEVKYKKH